MTEYKREKALLESELKDVRKRSIHHDDHLRAVDAWWSQLLDEVMLLTKNTVPESFNIDGSLLVSLDNMKESADAL